MNITIGKVNIVANFYLHITYMLNTRHFYSEVYKSEWNSVLLCIIFFISSLENVMVYLRYTVYFKCEKSSSTSIFIPQ